MLFRAVLSLLLVLVPLALFCQPQEEEKRYKLMNVIWSLSDHRLRWDVGVGHSGPGGKFVLERLTDQSEIDPDLATMSVAGETRKFSEQEAASLHRMLDTLAMYCAESTAWWDSGQGEKVQPAGLIASK